MAFTTINSAGSLYEGSDSAELVVIATGAATRTTIEAAGGNDTIQFVVSGDAASTALSIDGNAGADLIQLSGSNLFESTILGGAGGDTLSFQGLGELANGEIKAGDGSDTISIAGASISGTDIVLGGGADTLTFSGNAVDGRGTLTGSKILAGSGADVITITDGDDLSATTILGGGGADNITISGVDIGVGSLINLDSSVNGGGADTLTLIGGLQGTVKAKGGADFIDVSGQLNASARIEGNAGGDTINLSAAESIAGDNASVLAGSGNDAITIMGDVDGSAAIVKGGGGSDTITFNDGISAEGSALKIYGGAGSDTINLGNAFTGEADRGGAEATGVVSFASLSDSSVDAIDLVSGAQTISGIHFSLDTAAGITSFTIGAYNDSDVDTPSITAGIASGGSWESADSSVTSRVEQLDDLVTNKGTVVGFNANNVEYIFVQGGSEGTADDAVIQIDVGGSGVASFNVDNDYNFNAQF